MPPGKWLRLQEPRRCPCPWKTLPPASSLVFVSVSGLPKYVGWFMFHRPLGFTCLSDYYKARQNLMPFRHTDSNKEAEYLGRLKLAAGSCDITCCPESSRWKGADFYNKLTPKKCSNSPDVGHSKARTACLRARTRTRQARTAMKVARCKSTNGCCVGGFSPYRGLPGLKL